MIRRATSDDVHDIAAIYTPIVRDTIVSFESEPPSNDELVDRIESSQEWLVHERDNRVIAYAYAAPFHRRPAYGWSVEVSIYVATDARGTGIGRELLEELLRRLTERGFVNVFAGIALPNPASVALFESIGFEKIAHQKKVGFKLGAWHDVAWWQRQLRDPSIPPPTIR